MTTGSRAPVIEASGLSLTFATNDGPVHALSNVDLVVEKGDFVSFIGPSGCGKTTFLRVAADLEHPTSGTIRVNGMSPAEARQKRAYGYVFQSAGLFPWRTIEANIRLPLEIMGYSRAEQQERVRRVMALVELEGFEAKHPWQLSGGMRQRVAIAIALLNEPDVIIADEPTTALDVTIQAQILAEVQKLAAATGTAFVWITHDLAVVAGLADRLLVMYAGRIVESGPVDEVLASPAHPYTHGLIGSVPSQTRRGQKLRQIPGMTPSLLSLPQGCAFKTRCPRADAACDVMPGLEPVAPGREVRCWHPHPTTPLAAAS